MCIFVCLLNFFRFHRSQSKEKSWELVHFDLDLGKKVQTKNQLSQNHTLRITLCTFREDRVEIDVVCVPLAILGLQSFNDEMIEYQVGSRKYKKD